MYKKQLLFFVLALIATAGNIAFRVVPNSDDDFVYYTTDLKKTSIKFYWKDDKGQRLKSIGALNNYISGKGQKPVFAMNGGMYQQDGSPLGLYIEENKTLSPINKRNGSGNFYLQPNGIFYITTGNIPIICKSGDFINNGNIRYSTQSGPMLLMDGVIHPAFKQGSSNINTRNGVGILPGNILLFAMSKNKINFYDFASFFKKAGCSNALYLDGFVSRTYLPEKKWVQTDGDFGVMIAAIENK